MPQPRHWQKSTFSDGSDGDTCVDLAASTAPLTHLLHGVKSGLFLNPE
ncbi:DUF397 domain-containing protein [Streptomyces sp. NBC_01518]